VGADQSIVAYSAICAHRLTYPTREISFISYRNETSPGSKFAHVIHCCSSTASTIPPRGKVLAGPAPQPLAAIVLEHDRKDDGLYAVGTLGGELFQRVFQQVRIPPRSRSRRACPHCRPEPLRSERAHAVLQAAGEVLKGG